MPQIRVERDYYSNGQLRWEGSFQGERLEGPNRQWHENGVLAEEHFFEAGLEHGVSKQWNKEGKLLGEYHIHHGTGTSKSWHENGRLNSERSHVDGQFCGRFRCWFEDGELIGTEYHIWNKKVSKKKYLEACKKDPALPRYDDKKPEPEEPKIVGGYVKRETPISDWDRERHNEFINKFLRKPNRGEARQWLAGDENRFIGEMRHEDSVEFVEEGYKAGATKILAVDIQDETTNCLIVYLPPKGPKRKKVFEWNSEFAQKEGWDPYEDWGQNELFVFFD